VLNSVFLQNEGQDKVICANSARCLQGYLSFLQNNMQNLVCHLLVLWMKAISWTFWWTRSIFRQLI